MAYDGRLIDEMAAELLGPPATAATQPATATTPIDTALPEAPAAPASPLPTAAAPTIQSDPMGTTEQPFIPSQASPVFQAPQASPTSPIPTTFKASQIDALAEQLFGPAPEPRTTRRTTSRGLAGGLSDGSIDVGPQGGVVRGYDISRYATDPRHEQSVARYANELSSLSSIEAIDTHIQSVAPGSPVTGSMVASSASRYNVDPFVVLALMRQDSSYGTRGKGARTFNPGNVGNDDAGNMKNFGDWQQGVDAVAGWLSRHKAGAGSEGQGSRGIEGQGLLGLQPFTANAPPASLETRRRALGLIGMQTPEDIAAQKRREAWESAVDDMATELLGPPGVGMADAGKGGSLFGDIESGHTAGGPDAAETYLRAGRVMGVDTSSMLSDLEAKRKRWTLEKPSKAAQEEGMGGYRKWAYEGARSFSHSVSTRLPATVTGALFGGAAGALAGYVTSGAALFGLAEYDRFMEDAEKLGIPREEAYDEAVVAAIAETAFEASSDLLEMKMLKLFGGNLTEPVKGLIRRYVGNVLKIAPVEIATEAPTAAVQAAARESAGMPTPTPGQAALESIPSTAATSLFFAGLGTAAQGRRGQGGTGGEGGAGSEDTGDTGQPATPPSGPKGFPELQRVERIGIEAPQERFGLPAPPEGYPGEPAPEGVPRLPSPTQNWRMMVPDLRGMNRDQMLEYADSRKISLKDRSNKLKIFNSIKAYYDQINPSQLVTGEAATRTPVRQGVQEERYSPEAILARPEVPTPGGPAQRTTPTPQTAARQPLAMPQQEPQQEPQEAMKGEAPDAQGIRSDEGQVYPGGNVQGQGAGEGGQDLEFPKSEEPGGEAARQGTAEEVGQGEPAGLEGQTTREGLEGEAPPLQGQQSEQENPVSIAQQSLKTPLDIAAHEAASSPLNDKPQPTTPQIKADNAELGHFSFQGIPISIESPIGSVRKDVNHDPPKWQRVIKEAHYGRIKGVRGRDKDLLDVFVRTDNLTGDKTLDAKLPVFIIDQINPETGKFDELKAVAGGKDEQQALGTYLANYPEGWQGLGAITEFTMPEFKAWLKGGDATKPVGKKVPKVIETEQGVVKQKEDVDLPFAAGLAEQLAERKRLDQERKDREQAGKEKAEKGSAESEKPKWKTRIDEGPPDWNAGRTDTTRSDRGMIDPREIVGLPGENDEHLLFKRDRTGGYGTAKWNAFVQDVKQNGVKEPIIIFKEKDGKVHISEGNHRVRAAVEAGLKDIPVEIRYFGNSQRDGLVVDTETGKLVKKPEAPAALPAAPPPVTPKQTRTGPTAETAARKPLKEKAEPVAVAEKEVEEEPAAKEEPPLSSRPTTSSPVQPASSTPPTLTVSDLDTKSIIVKGDYTANKDRIAPVLKQHSGLYNGKHKGWVFPKKNEAAVRAALGIGGEKAGKDENVAEKSEQTAQPGPQRIIVGKNRDGDTIYSDDKGARYILEGGMRVQSFVLRPGYIDEQFMTVEEVEAEKPKSEDALEPEPSAPAPVTPAKSMADASREEEQAPAASSSQRLATWVKGKVARKESFTWQDLFSEADKAFSGTQAQGKYTPKDAYDAMEMGVNQAILASDLTMNPSNHTLQEAEQKVKELQNLIAKLPTQSKRTEEMDEFQQFSTPPPLAYLASWVANVNEQDTAIEPSAGIGGLAVFAKNAGAKVFVNELSPRRAAILEEMGFDRVFTENAEQLDNVLLDDVKPTVVVMNPPFSSTAGRIKGQRNTMNAARHIEQALNRLEDRGRLVAIVGRGMSVDAPSFRDWFAKIGKKYTVLADIGLSGKGYQKYGTTFDNRVIVIDKTGPGFDNIIKGSVEDVTEALPLLLGVRNARQRSKTSQGAESSQAQPGRAQGAQEGQTEPRPIVTPQSSVDVVGSGQQEPRPRQPGKRDGEVNEPVEPGRSDEGADGGKRGGRPGGASPQSEQVSGEPGTRVDRPGRGKDDSDREAGLRQQQRLEVSMAKAETQAEALSDSVYDAYKPSVKVAGTKAHPGNLVESAAMASVEAPPADYVPSIPKEVLAAGNLSDAQMETIVRAGQAHDTILEGGERQGFFIGDGTGVGKGREIAGVFLDNWNKGRKKGVWLSANSSLFKDARRDTEGIGDDAEKIFELGKVKATSSINASEGILFGTYDTLKMAAKGEQGKSGKRRIDQVVAWLGADFDGVIALDESHRAGNALQVQGQRGRKDPSKTALAVIELQDKLPNARVVYVSATGATEVMNLAYAKRLGLWGTGTPFPSVQAFVGQIQSGGIAAMELVSRDMKSMGKYLARSLSFHDVTYDKLEHVLTADQRDIYDKLAEGWQTVLNNLNEALQETGVVDEDGKTMDGRAKSAAMSAFWGSHQRFFNQIITSIQMPSVISRMNKELESGNACVIQLVNTNEASLGRAMANLEEDESLEDLDLTPRDQLMQYIERSFPIFQYEQYADEDGNVKSRPVLDANGNPVVNRTAEAMKERLLDQLGSIRVPDGPLEMILNEFGVKDVAEVTGRTQRVVTDESGKRVREKRSKAKTETDAQAFQEGEKNILVFSTAGGTGLSYHADLKAKNQKKRIHFLVQAGWRADVAVQGFGRTHRTNQKQAPHYLLVTTDLKGQKRFLSSIARRLDQLGALTKGQRQTGSQGFFSARDNLESEYATEALQKFLKNLLHDGEISGVSVDDFELQTGMKLRNDNGMQAAASPPMTQFLNRLLSLKYDTQNAVFDAFSKEMDAIVRREIENGTLDQGLENLKAAKIELVSEQTVHTDEKSGAETKYVELDVSNPTPVVSWEESGKVARKGYYQNLRSKNVWGRGSEKLRTKSSGDVVNEALLTAPSSRHQNVETIDLDDEKKWRRVEKEEAEKLWNDEYDKVPKMVTQRTHLISGAILPIWDRLTGKARIVRIQTDKGQRFLGRLINREDLSNTLRNLGASRTTAEYPTDRAIQLLGQGHRLELSNGWTVKESRVSGEMRIEIVGPNFNFDAELARAGVFTERVNWKTRYFIPTGTDAGQVLDKVTKSRPIVDDVAPFQGSGRVGAEEMEGGNAKEEREQEDRQAPTLQGVPKIKITNPEEKITHKAGYSEFFTTVVDADGGQAAKRVSGKAVKVKGLPDGREAFAYKIDGAYPWVVVDKQSGLALASGERTMENAVFTAELSIENVDKEEMDKVFAESELDLLPLYSWQAPGGQGTTNLYSGFPVDELIREIRAAKASIEELMPRIMPRLTDLGARIIARGHNTARTFKEELSRVLGDAFDAVRRYVLKIFAAAQRAYAKLPDAVKNEWGTFAGPKAQWWDKAEGKFSSLYDKREKFEIDDSGARIKKADEILPKEFKFKESDDGFHVYRKGKFEGLGVDKWRAAVDVSQRYGMTLDDILDHPELFKQYPELRKLGLTFLENPDGSKISGSYSPRSNKIEIRYPSKEVFAELGKDLNTNLKKDLLHEIQHAIQKLEDFARGGAPLIEKIKQQHPKEFETAIDRIKSEKPTWTSVRSVFGGDVGQTAAFSIYNRLAGEIEARDVASRSNLTPEQRRATPPYSSENIAPEDAIVRFGDGETQMAVAPKDLPESAKAKLAGTRVVGEDGEPLAVFHGGEAAIGEFKNKPDRRGGNGGFYFTPNARLASVFADQADVPGVHQVYLAIKNPKIVDFDTGASANLSPKDIASLKSQGFDGVIGKRDKTVVEYVVFNSDQIVSALSPEGEAAGKQPEQQGQQKQPEQLRSALTPPLQSEQGAIRLPQLPKFPNWSRAKAQRASTGDAEIDAALNKIGPAQKTTKEKLDAALDNWKLKAEQGIFDRFASLKALAKSAGIDTASNASRIQEDPYVAATMTTSLGDMLATMMNHGVPQWKEGAVWTPTRNKGLAQVFEPVADQLDMFLGWMVGKRAEKLMAEGRENYFTDAEIKALKRIITLPENKAKFLKVEADYIAFKKGVLDFAEASGVINAEERLLWDHDEYVPFYRIMEETQGLKGPRNKNSVASQYSGIKKLKGGESRLGDIFVNIMMNFSHLVDASVKNHATELSIQAAEKMGVAVKAKNQFKPAIVPGNQIKKIVEAEYGPLLESMGIDTSLLDFKSLQSLYRMFQMTKPQGPDVIHVLRDGKPVYYHIQDSLVLRSLSAVNERPWGGPAMKAMRTAKRLLTRGVTADPGFMIANLTRDTLSAWVVSPDFKAGVDSVKGAIKTFREDEDYVAMQASGAAFSGGYAFGHDLEAAKREVEKLNKKYKVDGSTVLNSVKKMWAFWEKFGSRFENATRTQIYANIRARGGAHVEAAYEAKRIMDYSKRGDWMTIKFLCETVPFFGARLQGAQRLYHGYRENPRGFATKGMILMGATLALYAMNADDDRYKELEEWDRDNYYHFFVLDEHFRLPKPFEVGAIFSTIPERLAEWWLGEGTSKEFARRMLFTLNQTFSWQPPQLIGPMIEQYANKSFFTGRPIEGQSLQALQPGARRDPWTGETVSVIGEATNVSPKRMEAFMRGYFGTLGTYALMASDVAVRWMYDYPDPPASRLDDLPVIRRFVQEDPARHTKYVTSMYEMIREVDQLYATVRRYEKTMEPGKAGELIERERRKLTYKDTFNKVQRQFSMIDQEIRNIHLRRDLTPEMKRKSIDELTRSKNELARDVYDSTKAAFK